MWPKPTPPHGYQPYLQGFNWSPVSGPQKSKRCFRFYNGTILGSSYVGLTLTQSLSHRSLQVTQLVEVDFVRLDTGTDTSFAGTPEAAKLDCGGLPHRHPPPPAPVERSELCRRPYTHELLWSCKRLLSRARGPKHGLPLPLFVGGIRRLAGSVESLFKGGGSFRSNRRHHVPKAPWGRWQLRCPQAPIKRRPCQRLSRVVAETSERETRQSAIPSFALLGRQTG